ncbi:hypothetical protein [Desulfurivibrio alkaliphilus]|uniref:DUF5723 domain-containing protein n=1 Tax=Desulfurivibrio alkaliphilus (strain DSM 19089 / UNIQEM U267 / AHT2) TaxID=589865 RepID=D6Z246_DESAT|nr:hypothetical protein [Desulfurivibrio alkaliphilus]ADH85621.1 conserved hypothetical protein [Desulfurivibrio alkaliphilus AHT 2]
MKKTYSFSRAGVAACVVAAGVMLAGQAMARTGYDYPYLYKDPRVMGMGGASVAVGGKNSSVFTNPAGLGRLEGGYTVDLLPVTFSYGKTARDFLDDMSDALDIDDEDEQLDAVLDVLADYRGDNGHISLETFPAVGWRGETVAINVGYLGSAKVDMRSHQGYGSEGLLEVDGRLVHGPVFGGAYEHANLRGITTYGASVKFLSMDRLERSYSARGIVDLVDDDDYDLEDDLEDGSAVGFDLGVMHDFQRDHQWSPTVGLSVLNFGDTSFGKAGTIPMTVNLGVSFSPEVRFFNRLVLAADYVDLFNNYEEDSDFMKRVRLGAGLQLWERRWTAMELQAGLYQGHYTFGADLRLAILSLGFVTYAEEMGAYSGQDADRRYMLRMNIGW